MRRHGPADGPVAVVLHGGPGARGSAVGLARGLADPLHVLEPWQRTRDAQPLSVARHVADLAQVIADHVPARRTVLIGESWGAMLALAFAAEHPTSVTGLALVGCGTFDPASRAEMQRLLEERTTPELRDRLARLDVEIEDETARRMQAHRLAAPRYTYQVRDDVDNDADARLDLVGHRETWSDMMRLQDEGVLPARFASIRCPVLMLHGTFDPHPGAMIRDGLLPVLPQLEYVALERCGHSPWVEAFAAARFFDVLRPFVERLAPPSRVG